MPRYFRFHESPLGAVFLAAVSDNLFPQYLYPSLREGASNPLTYAQCLRRLAKQLIIQARSSYCVPGLLYSAGLTGCILADSAECEGLHGCS